MLRFQGGRPTRNYLGRREQFRLLGLFGTLALVLLLMRVVGRATSWAWMFGADAVSLSDAPPPEKVDSRQPARIASAEGADVVRIAPMQKPRAADARETLPGLRRDLFAEVADDTVLRGGAEHDAFYRTLEVLRGTDELDAATPRPVEVSFLQLFRQPEAYRGEWVRLRGVVRRALPVQTTPNDYGVTNLYQVWMQPEGRPDDLLAVDVLQLPPGFPEGEKVNANATVDGVFFKRWAYPAGDGIRSAPLILARTVVWTPATPATVAKQAMDPVNLVLSFLAVFGVAGAVIWIVRTGRRDRQHAAMTKADMERLASLDRGNDVSRMLAELRARETDDRDAPSDSDS